MSKDTKDPLTQTGNLVELLARLEPLWRMHQAENLPRATSVPRLKLLATLAERGAMPMSGLKEALGVSAQNITGLVDRLEAAGEVQRRPDPEDRRKVLVKLTKKTKARVLEDRDHHRRQVGSVFDALSFKEQKQLTRALSKLIGALEERQAQR